MPTVDVLGTVEVSEATLAKLCDVICEARYEDEKVLGIIADAIRTEDDDEALVVRDEPPRRRR